VEQKITFFDKALAAVSPEAAVRRMTARYWINEFERGDWKHEQRGYSGGRSRHAAPESQRRNRQRIDRVWEARDMEEKFPFVRGLLDKLVQYTCGSITYQSRTGDTETDAA
jgi:hypothetical protein